MFARPVLFENKKTERLAKSLVKEKELKVSDKPVIMNEIFFLKSKDGKNAKKI